MSYILKALEKSEQERKQRTTPDLQTQHTLYPGASRSRQRRSTPRRRLRPAILFTILLVLCGWLFREHLPVALEIKITRSDALPDSSPAATPLDQQVTVQPEQPAAPATAAESSAPQVAGTTPQPTEPQATAEDSRELDRTVPDVADAAQEETISPSQPTTATSDENNIVRRTAVRLQPAPLVLSGDPASQVVAAVPPLPFPEDLPASIQNDLPKLHFAGHTYSARPEERLIIINNGIKREGDAVEPGLKLEEITWEGVIMNFRGLRFQVTTTGS